MSVTTFTFRVDDQLKAGFAVAAKAQDCTGAQLLRDFMRDYVRRQKDAAEHNAWFRHQVQAGPDTANASRLISSEGVQAEFTARRAQTRRQLGDAT